MPHAQYMVIRFSDAIDSSTKGQSNSLIGGIAMTQMLTSSEY